MTISRTYGKINFECDGCGEVLETETSNFQDALADSKSENWRAVNTGGSWSHLCPSCKDLI